MNKKATIKQEFSIYQIIQKKRDKGELSNDEIKWVVTNLVDGKIADYQMASLLMAMFVRGMSKKETQFLTDAMLYSGKVLDFKDKKVIDKHSTGGVGDKTSFILAPIAAACGVKVPMIAGRGLGHTGGTVDKIEAITGFNTSLSLEEFQEYLKKYGLVLIGQTKDIAPADKKIYALRDVTATVESIPLITASIMSKKLAEGASGIVMDVKTGPGAFMKTLKDSKALAESIMDTGIRFKKSVMYMITDMSQPLGKAVGNSLEIIESIETLRNKGPKDLTELSLSLAGGMVYLAGLSKTHAEGIKKAREVLENGKALEKFRELIKIQGGDSKFVDDYSMFTKAEHTTDVLSTKDGYISATECEAIGLKCVDLGGGRKAANDTIDFSVGFIIHKRIGDKVKKGEPLLTIHHHNSQMEIVKKITKEFQESIFKISKKKPTKLPKLIYSVKVKRVK